MRDEVVVRLLVPRSATADAARRRRRADEPAASHAGPSVTRSWLRACTTAAALALGAAALAAQTFEGGIEIIEVVVTVTDRTGRLVGGLTGADFEVFDDGDAQAITHFSADRTPISLGLLLDVSDSMRGKPIVAARLAISRFVSVLLDAQDEVFVGTFNHVPHPVSPWTQPPEAVARALEARQPAGGTAIYDAVVAAVGPFNGRRHGRAALIVVSDGADTASDVTLREAQERLRRLDAFVYAIAIDEESAQRRATRVSPEALRELTGPTGGYTQVVRSAEELPEATERIALELNAQYTLRYTAPRKPDGRWHAVRVRAKPDGLVTRAGRGYFAEAPVRRRGGGG